MDTPALIQNLTQSMGSLRPVEHSGASETSDIVRAVVACDISALASLLKKADQYAVNCTTWHAWTPLHFAVALYSNSQRRFLAREASKRSLVVDMLLMAGANPLLRDRGGLMPAALAGAYMPVSLKIKMQALASQGTWDEFVENSEGEIVREATSISRSRHLIRRRYEPERRQYRYAVAA